MDKPGLRAAIDLDHRVDDLFALTPDEFVAARNDLAKDLKSEKRVDDAKAIQILRRPSVAAWALNQLARRQPKLLEELFDAAQSLREAQANAMSGVRGPLRETMRQFADLVDTAADRAAESGGPRDELAASLRTGASDAEWWNDLRLGRVARLPEAASASDMWSAGAEPTAPAPTHNAPAPKAPAPRPPTLTAPTKPAPDAAPPGVELKDAQRRHALATKEYAKAQQRVERITLEVAVLEERAEAARTRLVEAVERAADAGREQAEAVAELGRIR